MTITKANLVDKIYNNSGISKATSIQTMETIMEILKRTLESGEDILISGFGKFEVKDKTERRGRNPQTGSDLTIDARRVVTFKSSGKLRDKLNGE